VRALCAILLVACVSPAAAQPSAPDASPGGAERISVGGEITATYGSEDPGFFNYATYAYDPLQNVRLVFDASVRPVRAVEVLAQVRTDGLSQARMAALYLRLRPWRARDVDLQVGRIPTAFGLFGRNGYGGDSPLIGRPLAYGYLLSLRRDSLPATTTDLLRMRGRGWLSNFPRGNTAADRGLPIVNADTWDTGAQVRLATSRVAWTSAITVGSLGSPRFIDDNRGRAVSTRVVVRPTPTVAIGLSGASGAYLSRTLDPVLAPGESTRRLWQRAAGVDMEVATGPWVVRGEVLASRWQVPALATGAVDPLMAMTGWVEGRVRLLPGLDLGLRLEHLGFSTLDAAGTQEPWEAAVSRVESGLAFVPARHLRFKIAAQRNRRPGGGRVRHDTLFAAQVGVWF
jgi:hypothetical protein